MIYLKENMRFLRKELGFTQGELADKLGVKRSHIGSYEEGRGVPKLSVIKQMAQLFGVSMDELLAINLIEEGHFIGLEKVQPSNMKLLSIVVNPENEERIAIVPVKASAGYLSGRVQPEYMQQLPNFSLPVAELSKGRSYRVFQIKGDSMLPIPPGAYIFCDYVEHLTGIREGKPYVLVTADEGIVYKRVFFKGDDKLLLKSDNAEYEPYTVELSDVFEIWQALGFLSFELPDPDVINLQKISKMVASIQTELGKSTK